MMLLRLSQIKKWKTMLNAVEGGKSISENISKCNSVFKNLHNYINNNQRKEYMIEEDK
jgi:hypothetical protein